MKLSELQTFAENGAWAFGWMKDERELLTAKEVADLLGVNVKTLRRWTSRFGLPVVRTPTGRLRYDAEEVEKWFAEKSPEIAGRRGLPRYSIVGGQKGASKAP